LKASEKSCTAAELVEQLIAAKRKDGASKRHLEDLDSRLNRFAKAKEFESRMVATITSAEIDKWLRGLKVAPISRNNFRRVLLGMFNYAILEDYATSNPAAKAAKAEVRGKEPGILTVQQTARLLETASPEFMPYLAIGAFAGLRRAELQRLDWSEVDFESGLIKVTAEKAKTARRRFVKMQPNLIEWRCLPASTKAKSRPTISRSSTARTAAGIEDGRTMRCGTVRSTPGAFRELCRARARNGTPTAVDLRHYRQLVRPKDAERTGINQRQRRRSCACGAREAGEERRRKEWRRPKRARRSSTTSSARNRLCP
jgi:integrase